MCSLLVAELAQRPIQGPTGALRSSSAIRSFQTAPSSSTSAAAPSPAPSTSSSSSSSDRSRHYRASIKAGAFQGAVLPGIGASSRRAHPSITAQNRALLAQQTGEERPILARLHYAHSEDVVKHLEGLLYPMKFDEELACRTVTAKAAAKAVVEDRGLLSNGTHNSKLAFLGASQSETFYHLEAHSLAWSQVGECFTSRSPHFSPRLPATNPSSTHPAPRHSLPPNSIGYSTAVSPSEPSSAERGDSRR